MERRTETTLWERYRKNGETEARDRLVERHLSLVHHVARRLERTTGFDVEYDDLVSAGSIGLLEAMESYDLDRGLAFSTHAAPRIRGAILDDRRRRDPVSRSVRRRKREVRRSERELESTLGRAPREHETARAMGVDSRTLGSWRLDARGADALSLDQPTEDEEGVGLPMGEIVADESAEEIEERLMREDDVRLLRDAILELSEQDRVVLSLYHFEGLQLKEIARALDLTESRISQIRSRALERLRERLGGRREDFFSPVPSRPRRTMAAAC